VKQQHKTHILAGSLLLPALFVALVTAVALDATASMPGFTLWLAGLAVFVGMAAKVRMNNEP
jgi:FtsH-binding integral membrane protein